MTIISVRIETIKYGDREVEVAFNVDNTQDFFVTFPTVESILDYREDSCREKIASKSLKTFLGKDSVPVKIPGKIVNKPQGKDGTNKVSLLKFDGFIALASWEAFKNQNEYVARLLAAGFADSFRSLAYEQTGQKLTAEERNRQVAARMKGKVTRRSLTDAVKEWYQRNPGGTTCPMGVMIGRVTDAVYLALWEMKAIEIESKLGCCRHESRDSLSEAQLAILDRAEDRVTEFIDLDNIKPIDAVAAAGIRPARVHL